MGGGCFSARWANGSMIRIENVNGEVRGGPANGTVGPGAGATTCVSRSRELHLVGDGGGGGEEQGD